MRSCCFGCEFVNEDKACRRCRQCEKRLALLDAVNLGNRIVAVGDVDDTATHGAQGEARVAGSERMA